MTCKSKSQVLKGEDTSDRTVRDRRNFRGSEPRVIEVMSVMVKFNINKQTY